MDWVYYAWELLLSLEEILLSLLLEHPVWVLVGLFVIILLESSILPFLPGDTLLFAAGVALRTAPISVHVGALLFLLATVLGVTLNYVIGRQLRERIQTRGLWGITTAQLRRTERLIETHGGRLLVLGRFLPGVRVVVSLLAGSGRMPFARFMLLNLLGGIPWIGMFVYAGYCFGALPWVHAYFMPAVVLTMLVGLLPVLVRWGRAAWRRSHPGSPLAPP
jgi:membrane-associated protein